MPPALFASAAVPHASAAQSTAVPHASAAVAPSAKAAAPSALSAGCETPMCNRGKQRIQKHDARMGVTGASKIHKSSMEIPNFP